MKEHEIFAKVVAELDRARTKFPDQDVWITLAALTEEVGELNQAILQKTFEPKKGKTNDDIRKEAIQVMTVTMRVLFDCGMFKDDNQPELEP